METIDVGKLQWWEREKLLTEKDREAIQKAMYTRWEDIDENAAETEAGKYEIQSIRSRKRHNDEWLAGML